MLSLCTYRSFLLHVYSMTTCMGHLSHLRLVRWNGHFQPVSCDLKPCMRLRTGPAHTQLVHCTIPTRSTAFERRSASATGRYRVQLTALPATKRRNGKGSPTNNYLKALTNTVKMSATKTANGPIEAFAMEGPMVALLMPFKPSSLEIDDAAFVKYLDHLWAGGIRNVVVNGSTGEFPSMTLAERKHAAELCRGNWRGKVVVGVSSTAVPDCIDLLKHASERVTTVDNGKQAVADAVLLLPPYYFSKTPDAGIEKFISSVLQHTQLPSYLYNYSVHTGNVISVESYKRLASQLPHLRGIKCTVTTMKDATSYKEAMPDLQVYLGGIEAQALEGLQKGLDGVIAGSMSAVLPHLVSKVDAEFRKCNLDSAREAQDTLNKWGSARDNLGLMDVGAGKAAMAKVVPDFPPTVRPALVEASAEETEKLQSQYPA